MELLIYTIYDHPHDYPDHFVVRRKKIINGFPVTDESFKGFADTLEEARLHIPPGLYRLERDPSDYLSIVESYI